MLCFCFNCILNYCCVDILQLFIIVNYSHFFKKKKNVILVITCQGENFVEDIFIPTLIQQGLQGHTGCLSPSCSPLVPYYSLMALCLLHLPSTWVYAYYLRRIVDLNTLLTYSGFSPRFHINICDVGAPSTGKTLRDSSALKAMNGENRTNKHRLDPGC